MATGSTSQGKDAEVLSLPLEFELERSGQHARGALVALLLFVAASIAVLAIAPIRSVVIAAGAIQPAGEVTAAHHDRGGEVEAVFVSRGDTVVEGQPLLRLRSAEFESEVEELTIRSGHLALRIERLQAHLETRAPDFRGVDGVDAMAIANEERQFDAGRSALKARLASIDAEFAAREATLDARREEAAALEPAIAALDRRYGMMVELLRRGTIAHPQLTEVATERSDTRSRHASAIGAAATTEREIAEIVSRRESTLAERRAEWSAALAEALSLRGEVMEQLSRRKAALIRQTVLAPTGGVVQRLGGAEPGVVIAQGGLAAEIVATDRPMVARVRVSPEEIGHIGVGDEAKLMIATFGLQPIGELQAEIRLISPTVFTEQDGTRYYEVDLDLLSEQDKPVDLSRLSPGMSLSANILGHESSILAYLLQPVIRALDLAFTSN
ncbi:MAG: HlyD family type I secretion periplasmic adaptor subunit [Pseudomonadota bacterium]